LVTSQKLVGSFAENLTSTYSIQKMNREAQMTIMEGHSNDGVRVGTWLSAGNCMKAETMIAPIVSYSILCPGQRIPTKSTYRCPRRRFYY